MANTSVLQTALPPLAHSAYGKEFHPASDSWSVHDFGNGKRLLFGQLNETATPELKNAIKRVFLVLAQTRNADTCRTALNIVRQTAKAWLAYSKQPMSEISPKVLVVAIQAGYGLELWRMVLRIWVLQDPSKTIIEAMDFATNSFAAKAGRNSKKTGKAVLVWDEESGAYRPEEDKAIDVALNIALAEGTISDTDYTMIRMFRGLGMRPVQLAAMKACDFREKNGTFEVQIPLAKQRGIGERTAFMPWKIVMQGLGLRIKLQIEKAVIPQLAEGSKLEDAPLFPKRKGKIAGAGLDQHIRPDFIHKIYVRTFRRLKVISPVTGKIIQGNPRRDRHTFMTMLAMDGCTIEQIAASAGHSEPRSCEVYIEASTDHFQRMESVVGAAFVPVADRFMGRVVARENDEQARGDQGAVLYDRELNSVGSCAVGGCNAIEAGVAPIACYTCRKFRAWEDAPHAVLLDALEQEREALITQGHHAVADTKSSTIIAIADLMQAIHERKKARAHG